MEGKDEASVPHVRRVVSWLEDVVCESPEFDVVYGLCASTGFEVAKAIRHLLENQAVEIFVALLLNAQNFIIGYFEVSKGTLTSSLVHPREVFGPAIRLGAASVIVAHNHPSGDPDPSQSDVEVTQRLLGAGKLLGIPLLDHIIIGSEGRFQSLRRRLDFS